MAHPKDENYFNYYAKALKLVVANKLVLAITLILFLLGSLDLILTIFAPNLNTYFIPTLFVLIGVIFSLEAVLLYNDSLDGNQKSGKEVLKLFLKLFGRIIVPIIILFFILVVAIIVAAIIFLFLQMIILGWDPQKPEFLRDFEFALKISMVTLVFLLAPFSYFPAYWGINNEGVIQASISSVRFAWKHLNYTYFVALLMALSTGLTLVFPWSNSQAALLTGLVGVVGDLFISASYLVYWREHAK